MAAIETPAQDRPDRPPTYDTTLRRALTAALVGALIGAAVIALFSSLQMYQSRASEPFGDLAFFAVAALVTAFLGWLAGLVMLAGLPWITLHVCGRRHWSYAVLLGAGLLALVSLLGWTGDDRGASLRLSVSFCVLGAAVGTIIWRLAYRRVHPRPQADVG